MLVELESGLFRAGRLLQVSYAFGLLWPSWLGGAG